MSKVARLGDAISCGSFTAGGSPTVYANGMPITTASTNPATGHGDFKPTTLMGPYSSTVFVNNSPVALMGITNITPHDNGVVAHGGTISSGSANVEIE